MEAGKKWRFAFLEQPEDALMLHEKEMAEMERVREERERTDRYRRSVPQRYWKESLDTFKAGTPEQERQLKAVRDFTRTVNCGAFRSLILLGAAGTGKTHLACSIVRECGGKYRTSPDIVEEIRRAKSFSAQYTESETIGHYARTPLLIIDEVGRGLSAQEEQYALYRLIDARYNTRRPTVLVSNLLKRDFINYIGAAAADRLMESAATLEFTGGSHRAELRKAALERL